MWMDMLKAEGSVEYGAGEKREKTMAAFDTRAYG